MGSLGDKLHICFFPYVSYGHMIPALDMAKVFASRGVKTTIITTPLHAHNFSKSIQTTQNLGFEIDIRVLRYPFAEAAALPQGSDNSKNVTGMLAKFPSDTTMLQNPLEEILQELRPDCLVADVSYQWPTNSAAKFGIPTLVFHAKSIFASSAMECVNMYQPYKKVSSDSEPFIIPSLPGEIKLTRMQLPKYTRPNQPQTAMNLYKESELNSFGIIFNSFYELESDYVDFYRKELGKKTWQLGPVSLCNRAVEDKAWRGRVASINGQECLKWLDSRTPDSVVYICFGSLANFTSIQLKEIAVALEASGKPFIWVVRQEQKGVGKEEEWLPSGFEARMEGKGLIIKGWAPQVLILEHEAIGGFVTHCGWNSTLEGISAGKPMVTWPVFNEQFYNEKFVTDVLKIGVGVGVKRWVNVCGDEVKSEAIEKGIRRIMEGEEGEEMRRRARNLGKKAREAVEKDGSSYSDLNDLLDQLKHRKQNVKAAAEDKNLPQCINVCRQNVTADAEDKSRPQRARQAPTWHKDFIIG